LSIFFPLGNLTILPGASTVRISSLDLRVNEDVRQEPRESYPQGSKGYARSPGAFPGNRAQRVRRPGPGTYRPFSTHHHHTKIPTYSRIVLTTFFIWTLPVINAQYRKLVLVFDHQIILKQAVLSMLEQPMANFPRRTAAVGARFDAMKKERSYLSLINLQKSRDQLGCR
jgi:hypothetical protein